ncbi:hypothetical protein LPJ61_001145 [Coemansia biformis]|uniref:Uncharacterized protein n=1 Tax=Coemansia biformis TaxID=1286918 RepID=A0A9W8D0C9_9FUNG|nr:hypothetical protein LPJ61_001145 [Coemansia biformis]
MRIESVGHGVSAVSVSGALGARIRRLGNSAGLLPAQPTVCAYLLGYVDCDGVAQLNRLDLGIQSSGGRLPTAAHATDAIIPLYRGAAAGELFYASALRPGHIFQVAGRIVDPPAGGHGDYTLEFINIEPDIRVSVEPASAIEIVDLPGLLDELRRDPGAARGPLRREEDGHAYSHERALLLPTERAIWAVPGSGGGEDVVRRAYIDTGMPRSLHIAQVIPDDGCRSALVRHCVVAPVAGEFRVHVRLASVELPAVDSAAASTARLVPVAKYGRAAAEAIRAGAGQHRVAVDDQARDRAQQPLPKAFAPGGDTVPSSHMAELLTEQRQIRALLEEQNSLIKTQVSQAQEMMRLAARQQPSPQTVTRRYLRMRGTHTPTLTGVQHRALGVDGARSTTALAAGQSMRRSNSLSEIVDGIRSFDVEGYEETEQYVDHGRRGPLSFAPPLGAGGALLIEEGPSQPRATSAGSLGASSGIPTLVTRINRLVSAGSGTAAAATAPGAFERPPVPAYGRPPVPSHAHEHKITPTTQKYLDALGGRGAAPG